jgi:branched-chain amino acid aminotransferase
VLELCAAQGIDHAVRNISVMEVYRADEMFCTGTMGELAAVTELDGRTIGDGTRGPMTERLSTLYREETASSGYALWDDTE